MLKRVVLKEFLTFFSIKSDIQYSGDLYHDFITQLGGRCFGHGLFRSFLTEDVVKWKEIVTETYPEFTNCFELFGHDWLGRCFAIDLRKKTYGNVLMFEIGTLDVLEIPCSFVDFLNVEIPSYSDACLAESFFRKWSKSTRMELKDGRCAGYKVPLFLGGEDTVTNLEDVDMEVYWAIMAQIRKQL